MSASLSIFNTIRPFEEADLENWARLNGYWHDDPHAYFKELGYKFYGYGGEAQVYTEGDGYVHKICIPEIFG